MHISPASHGLPPTLPTPQRRPESEPAFEAEPSTAGTPDEEEGQGKREDAAGSSGTNTAEVAQLRELKTRDRVVRAHEAAHLAAAGGYARSGMSFSYERGPDGVLYAVGGEVSIDTAPVPGDPEETLRKAEQVRRAALAPAEPSSQDQMIAAKAAKMAAQARAELAEARQAGGEGPAADGGAASAQALHRVYGISPPDQGDVSLDLFA